jgi:hypothetical protein
MNVKIFESIINHKINNITTDELLKYAKQYNITVKREHAKKIANYLRGKQVNIFDSTQRAVVVKEIAKIAGADTAREVNKLFTELTK